MSRQVHLKIEGMTCNHCVTHTKQALEAVDGVENADVKLEPGGAVISGNASVDALISAIKTAGYTATEE